MKNGTGFQIGPGMASLLMILVALLMAALAILAFAGARADSTLSQRNLEAVQEYYEAAARMQRMLFNADRDLAEARKNAAGDAQAYARRVQEMQSEYQASQATGGQEEIAPDEDEGEVNGSALTLRLVVPMRDDHYLEAKLDVTPGLTGRRYALVSHKVVNGAPWDGSRSFELFGL